METVDTITKAFEAGRIVGKYLRIIDGVSHLVIIPPEQYNLITTSHPGVTGLDDPIELYKWDDGKITFHVGYSEKTKTVILAFPEEL